MNHHDWTLDLRDISELRQPKNVCKIVNQHDKGMPNMWDFLALIYIFIEIYKSAGAGAQPQQSAQANAVKLASGRGRTFADRITFRA